MATILSTTGVAYHLFGIPCSIKDATSHIEFSELENNLGDSFFSQRLFGSDTGNRSWSLTMPTLTGTTATVDLVTGVNDGLVTKEQYVWDLFCECKVTGKPFVYQDPRNAQYYMCDFADKKLSLQRMFAKLYSTGVEFKQRRIPGETVFNIPGVFSALNSKPVKDFNETTHNLPAAQSWQSSDSIFSYLTGTGDVVFAANPLNGHNTVRLNGSASTGRLISNLSIGSLHDVFIVMKMRETTFTNNCGLLSSTTGSFINGTSGGTKWQNPSHTGLEYKKNGVTYAVTDMQAPMNTFAVIQFHAPESNPLPPSTGQIIIGQSGSTAGTFAKVDIAEIILSAGIGKGIQREITESLLVKWGIGG